MSVAIAADARAVDPAPGAVDRGELAGNLLPAHAFASLDTQAAEDAAIWSRLWTCVGFAAEIPAAGDVLPFTVGHHGIHLERMADGSIAGRFNKAQHGGCRVVPLQCRIGAKTRCSFTACGHSRDRAPILTSETSRDAQLDQYLGLRPERLLPVAVHGWGPLLLARLDPHGDQRLAWPHADDVIGPVSAGASETTWREVSGDWKRVASVLAASHDRECTMTVLFPNVVVQRGNGAVVVAILQPIALDRTLVRVRTFGPAGSSGEAAADAVEAFLDRAEAASHQTAKRSPSFETTIAAAIGAFEDADLDAQPFRTDRKRGW